MPMEKNTKALFRFLLEWQKTHYLGLAAMTAELSALRETVRSLDPTFSEIMEQRRIQELESTSEAKQQIVDDFDRMFRVLDGL
jgi:hypothetical protein